MKRIFSFLLILCTFDAFAITFGQNSYPAEVDLRDQFRARTQIQQGGTCHIFAATALFEAACFRSIGERINISENQLIIEHLRSQVSSNRLGEFLRAEINEIEGGHPEESLRKLLRGEILTEAEVQMSARSINDIYEMLNEWRLEYQTFERIVKIYVENRVRIIDTPPEFREFVRLYSRQKFHHDSLQRYVRTHNDNNDTIINLFAPDLINSTEESIRFHLAKIEELKNQINALFEQKIQEKRQHLQRILDVNPQDSAVSRTINRDINRCLTSNDLNQRSIRNPSQEEMISLLANKIPFICSAVVQFSPTVTGMHAFTVIGYTESNNGVDYLVRDSNRRTPQRGWDGWDRNCIKIDYISNGE